MSLNPRHRWCVERIVECFRDCDAGDAGGDDGGTAAATSASAVETFIRQPVVLARFNALFAGQGPPAVFVHCHSLADNIENVDSNTLNALVGDGGGQNGSGAAALTKRKKNNKAAAPNGRGPEGMMQLVLSDGGSVVTPGGNGGNSNGRPSVVDKFCYFVRQGEVVYTSITSDASLLYGEICGNPLESVRALLSSAYGELFAVSREWGKAKQDKREELTNEVDRFVAGLTAALDSMEGGLVLRRPTMEQLEICRIEESSGGTSVATRPTATSGLVMGGVGAPAISTSAANQRANQSPEIVVGLEQLLDEWCSDMESYMEKKVATVVPATAGSRGLSFRGGGGGGGGGDDPSSEAAVDVGPRGELTYWRGRMQRLQSVHEQLTQPQCKRIVDFMAALSRGSVVAAATAAAAAALNGNGNASLSYLTATSSTLPGSSAIVIDKVKIAGLVQRWKRIDVAVTEAANEAKDNVKYLFSLRKSFEPLYSGTRRTSWTRSPPCSIPSR
jgi:hypothetical protein